MSLIAKDLPSLVFMLLPGFMAAGVFYTLTSHPKASEFERLIQALIFTSILKALTITLRGIFLVLGSVHPVAPWTSDVELVWSIVLSVPLGALFAWLANTDKFHRLARLINLSSRTSYPSEWYGAFTRQKRWVLLHLADGRRIYGWAEEWPDQPDKGHFVLDQPEWLLDNNERAPMFRVERFMLPAAEVKMVEFLKENAEVTQDPAEVREAERLLLEAQKTETPHGIESATTGTEPTGTTGPTGLP